MRPVYFFFLIFSLSAAVSSEGAWAPNNLLKSKAVSLFKAGSITDPTGDTYGSGSPQLDITTFSAIFNDTNLVVSITLSNTIDPMNFGGIIDIDTDQNRATGDIPFVNEFSPYDAGMGDEYFISFSAADTTAYLIRTSDYSGTTIPLTVSGNRITFEVPVSSIGGTRAVNLATVIGTQDEPTDAAPNGGFISVTPSTTVPALNGWGAAFFAVFAAAGSMYFLRGRQTQTEDGAI